MSSLVHLDQSVCKFCDEKNVCKKCNERGGCSECLDKKKYYLNADTGVCVLWETSCA